MLGDSTSEWGDPLWPENLKAKFNNTNNQTLTNVEVWNLSKAKVTAAKRNETDYRKTDFYAWAIKSTPDIVFIMLGANDAKTEYWNQTLFEDGYKDLAKTFIDLPS